MRTDSMLETSRLADGWELAAKIGGVTALIGSVLRWLLTPLFIHHTKKALAPEIREMRAANARAAVQDARLDAIDERLARIEHDVDELRARVDALTDWRTDR
jgi:ubiquinone biosynthesis protein UbiJ